MYGWVKERLFMETGWSIDKPADLPLTFRHDILATNFDEAKKTFQLYNSKIFQYHHTEVPSIA